MMRKLANIILGIIVVLLVVWELPWLYNNYAVSFLHGDEIGGQPFTLYSGLADEFIQNTVVASLGANIRLRKPIRCCPSSGPRNL